MHTFFLPTYSFNVLNSKGFFAADGLKVLQTSWFFFLLSDFTRKLMYYLRTRFGLKVRLVIGIIIPNLQHINNSVISNNSVTVHTKRCKVLRSYF